MYVCVYMCLGCVWKKKVINVLTLFGKVLYGVLRWFGCVQNFETTVHPDTVVMYFRKYRLTGMLNLSICLQT